MKNYKKTLLFLILFIGLTTITGCIKRNPTAKFKNPKTIEYKTDKGSIKLSYDDDGTYEVYKNIPYIVLKNKDSNFRIDIDYSNNTIKQQEESKKLFKKNSKYLIIDNIKFNGYKGYAMVQKQYTTTNIYLVLDKKNNIISNIKVSPVITSNAIKELNKKTKPEDVLYKQEKVQQILKTIQYKKETQKN